MYDLQIYTELTMTAVCNNFAVATDPADAGDGIDTGMTTSTSSTCNF